MKGWGVYSVLLAACALQLTACGGGGSTVSQTSDGYVVSSGLAQKGPLARGSVVTVNELEGTKLAPNGKSYTFETIDDYGTFTPSSIFGSPYLEVTAQGYFFNELTGVSGKDWVVLRGLSNLSTGADKAVNVNVLSHLTKDRVRTLLTANPALGFQAAREQAQRELLRAFYIHSPSAFLSTSSSTPGNFMELDLKSVRAADQVLAAISGMVMALGQSGGGISSLLSQVQTDLADDGLLNNSPQFSTGVQTRFNAAATSTDFAQVAVNLNTFYGLLTPGSNPPLIGNKTYGYSRSTIAQWVDSSGGVDQVIDKYKSSVTGIPFGSPSYSPAYSASAEDVGQCLAASSGVLHKNGVAQVGAVAVAAGDQFAIALTPTALSPTPSAFLQRSAPSANGSCNAANASVRVLKYSVTGVGDSGPGTPVPAEYLGANLPGVYDYSYTPVYTDLVNQGRCFGPATGPWGACVPVGADGWPTGDFGIFLMVMPGQYGTYKVSFTGQADVSLMASAYTSIANKVYDPLNNRTTLDVVRSPTSITAQQMVLGFTNTGSGIKNLKVVRPGYDALNPPLFTQEFINHIARFKTLRFMDMLRTNNSTVSKWSERATLNTHYAASAGVPWEHVVALANQASKDIWINIPLLADDDYILKLAQLLKATLRTDLKVYVEYSNEVWNSSFSQYGKNRDLATAQVAANPASTLVYDGTTNPDVMMYRHTAKRGMEISNIFRSVYGDAAMMSTVRPIFASQIVQPYVAQLGLDYIDAVYGPPSRYFYAFAGAPYYNMGSVQTMEGLTTAQVLDAMETSINNMTRISVFEDNLALARWYQLPFFAYEGGSDTFGPGSIAAKKAANLDSRMLTLCRSYLNTWYANGGEMMLWFTAGAGNWDTQYGTWELTPDIAITDTPKIQCMDQTLASTLPTLQGRNQVPGSFSSLAYVGNPEPFTESSKNTVRYLHPTSPPVQYLVLAPQAGSYSLILTADSSTPGNAVDVSVNGKLVAPGFEFQYQGWDVLVNNTPIPITLNKGYNVIRIRTVKEKLGFYLRGLTVQ